MSEDYTPVAVKQQTALFAGLEQDQVHFIRLMGSGISEQEAIVELLVVLEKPINRDNFTSYREKVDQWNEQENYISAQSAYNASHGVNRALYLDESGTPITKQVLARMAMEIIEEHKHEKPQLALSAIKLISELMNPKDKTSAMTVRAAMKTQSGKTIGVEATNFVEG